MEAFIQSGDCAHNFDEVSLSEESAEPDDKTQNISKMQTVITEFGERLWMIKDDAFRNLLQGISGLHSAVCASIGGKPCIEGQGKHDSTNLN